MPDEIDSISSAALRAHLSRGTIFFQCGLIVLGSLFAGQAYFQIAQIPEGFALNGAEGFRLVLGAFLGSLLSFIGLVIYVVWYWLRGRRLAKKEYDAMVAAAIRQLDRKD